MTIAQSRDPSEPENAIITASGIYADILSRLTYGLNANSTTDIFTIICTIRTSSSWQWVSFHSDRYTSVFPDDIYCGSGHPEGSGFTNLYYAIEGATRLVSGPDGYSRYLNLGIVQGNTLTNEEFRNSTAEDEQTYAYIYNMTQPEYIPSQLYEIVQTAYKATAGEDAVPTAVHVLTHDYKYRIYVSWTALSILAMMLENVPFQNYSPAA